MFKNSKSLGLGLAAILIVAASFVFLSKKTHDVAVQPSLEQVAPAAGTSTSDTEGAVAGVTYDAAPDLQVVAQNTTTAAPAAVEEHPAAATELSSPAAAVSGLPEMQDRVLGQENAPVTIIEYASMTCSHCAHFSTKILPEVKKKLIDTGKAKLIFREFPLDGMALKASMMARCVSPDKFYNMLEVIFSNQERWAHDKEPLKALAQLGSLAGMTEEQFKTCTENKALETAILGGVQSAQNKYNIEATPTFIFNDGAEKLSGAQSVDQFEAVVNKLGK